MKFSQLSTYIVFSMLISPALWSQEEGKSGEGGGQMHEHLESLTQVTDGIRVHPDCPDSDTSGRKRKRKVRRVHFSADTKTHDGPSEGTAAYESLVVNILQQKARTAEDFLRILVKHHPLVESDKAERTKIVTLVLGQYAVYLENVRPLIEKLKE